MRHFQGDLLYTTLIILVELLQSPHYGPLFGPHLPSEPGIAAWPNILPQYKVFAPDPVPRAIGTPALFFCSVDRSFFYLDF